MSLLLYPPADAALYMALFIVTLDPDISTFRQAKVVSVEVLVVEL